MIQPKSELICCENFLPTIFDERITFKLINFENKYEDEKSLVSNESEKQHYLLTPKYKNQNDHNFWNKEEYIQDDSDIKINELPKFNFNKENYYLNSYEKNKGISYTDFGNTEKIISLDESLVFNMKKIEKYDNFGELNKIYNISSYSKIFSVKHYDKRKYDEYLIIKKIKIHYINFCVNFINILLREKGRIQLKFCSIKSEIKEKVTKDIIIKMRKQNLEDVICEESNHNKTTYDTIKKEKKALKDITYILKENFLFLFDAIFYTERKQKYNLNEFGLQFDSFEFHLPKNDIELYEDLSEKKENNFMEYKQKMNLCCKKYFLPKGKYICFNVGKINRKKKREKLIK